MTPEEQAARQRRVSELRWQYDAAVYDFNVARNNIKHIKNQLEDLGEVP